jgi:chromosome segregation ATPase
MQMRNLVLLCTVACASSLLADNANQERPIAKVIRMLNDMAGQLKKEADADAEMYEQMACWCETGGKAKEAAIKMQTQRIADLGAAMDEYSAKADQLKSDIEGLETDVSEKTSALEQATSIRDKELAEFNANEKDMIQSITSLKSAVITLSKAHGESALIQVKDLLKHQAKKFKKHHPVFSLIQQRTSTLAMEKTPASGEIYGVLKQMKESFETNLESDKKEEAKAAEEYVQMKEAKTAELAAANSQIESKTVELGATEQSFAQATQDKKDTEASLEADQGFLADLKDKCAVADEEYAARVKVRTEEQKAISDTIGILTNEEANDAFTKSMTFFLQTSKKSNKRAKASLILKAAAQKSKNPRLVTLAMSMRLDAFAKVKQNIDIMVKELKQESADEVVDRDYCIKSLNENDKQTAAANDMKGDLDTKIADLTASIDKFTEELAALSAEVTETQVEMKKASAIREEENKDFTMTISDQRATQAILEKALARLADFYNKKAAFLQEQADQPGQALAPPPEQATYAKSSGGGKVMAMIEDVVKESKEIETQAIADETSAQAAYEGFIKDSNKLITANTNDIANKSSAKAKADAELAQAKGDLKGTIDTILTLADTAKTLHDQCDFLLKHFTERQSNRAQEIDALNQAKAIFSGMKF